VAIGFKTVIPNRYDAVTQNPVTMRLLLYFTQPNVEVPRPTQCELFEIAGVRMQDGQPIGTYVEPLWLVLTPRMDPGDMFLVVDVPINTPDGLDAAADLAPGQMLAFGLSWVWDAECTDYNDDYRIIGVEFFESETAALAGATIEPVATVRPCECGQASAGD
jgi:hypothetical protein